MANSTRHFYDLDLSFGKNPLTGDILKKIDNNAIKQSIKNLIEYSMFDVPFHPEIRGQIRDLLFENFTPLTKISLERNIENVIENYEPRVQIIDVEANENIEKNAISISLQYKIVNASVINSTEFYIYRNR